MKCPGTNSPFREISRHSWKTYFFLIFLEDPILALTPPKIKGILILMIFENAEKNSVLKKNLIFIVHFWRQAIFILPIFSERNYHLALQLRTFRKNDFLSLMQSCFSKYLKIYKNWKGPQCNFPLENNFGFLEKTHHLIKNSLPSSCPNIVKKSKIKNFSTQYCLTTLSLNFEKTLHSGSNTLSTIS